MGLLSLFNLEGVVRNLVRKIQLDFGYEINPIIIADTDAHAAPSGTIFYQFRALEDTVINAILDVNGDAVAGWAGKTITARDEPYNFRCSSIDLTSGSIIAYLKNTNDL